MPRVDAPVKIIIAAFGAVWLGLASIGNAAELELRVIPLKHRLGDEIVPILRPLLAPGESVNSIDSRLIVRASPSTLALIRRTLDDVDTRRRNLRISVRQGNERHSLLERQAVSGEIRSGTSRIVTRGPGNSGGLVFERSGPAGHIKLQSERHLTAVHNTATQSLTVQDGGHAFLQVGQSVPEIQPFLALVGNRLSIAAGVQYYDVTTGFDVEPRQIGERVQLMIWPRLVFGSSMGREAVDFQELRTLVTVNPGEWFDLGSSVGSGNAISREILLGSGRNRDDANLRFLIRIDPL